MARAEEWKYLELRLGTRSTKGRVAMSQYDQNGIEHLEYETYNRIFKRCLLYSDVETKASRKFYG
jgi:hypothetical protein